MRFFVASCALVFAAFLAAPAHAETPTAKPAHSADSTGHFHRAHHPSRMHRHDTKGPRVAQHQPQAGGDKANVSVVPPFEPPAASMSRPRTETSPAAAAPPSEPKKPLPPLPPAHGKRARNAKPARQPRAGKSI